MSVTPLPLPDSATAMQRRILRRMREPNARLVAARDVELCGVLILNQDGTAQRQPVATCTASEAFSLFDAGWIEPVAANGVSARYEITDAGRAHVANLLNQQRARLDGRNCVARPDGETLVKWSAKRHLRRQGRVI